MSRIAPPALLFVALIFAAPRRGRCAAEQAVPGVHPQAGRRAAEERQGRRPRRTSGRSRRRSCGRTCSRRGAGRRASPRSRATSTRKQHGEPLKRDGYTVEKITFQTRPGVRMTANLYVPDAAKKKQAPAILQVHGHWRGAKQDPVVQSRCIGAAKLGFVVLCVDAFGAGERGVGTALGEYHGDMTAATLLPLGTAAVGPAGVREHAGGRLPRNAARGGQGQDRHHRGERRRQPDDVRRRVGQAVQVRRAGLLGRQLPGVPRTGVLHVRGRPRGAAVHGGVGGAGARPRRER